MSVTTLFSVLFLVLPLYSLGGPVNKEQEMKRRTRDVFFEMYNINPGLQDLIYATRRAYAKEHFGDPDQSRKVTLNGVELLSNCHKMTVQTFVPKLYKQLSIFQAIFEDILHHWSRSREEKRKIVKKVEAMANKIGDLKGLVRVSANMLSLADSLVTTDTPQLKQRTIWTGPAYQKDSWILGVFGEFETSVRCLQPAFNKFSKE